MPFALGPPMTGDELAAVRARLGLTAYQWAQLLGYSGSRATLDVAVSRLERGERPIGRRTGLLARMYERYGVPDDHPVTD